MASLRKVKHMELNLSKRRAIGGHWSDSYTNNMVEKPEKGKIHFYIFNFSLAKVDIT